MDNLLVGRDLGPLPNFREPKVLSLRVWISLSRNQVWQYPIILSSSTLSPFSFTIKPSLSLIAESGSSVPNKIETYIISGQKIPWPSKALLFSRSTPMARMLFLSDLSWWAIEQILKNFCVIELPVFIVKCSLRFWNIFGTSFLILAPSLSRIPLRLALEVQETRIE